MKYLRYLSICFFQSCILFCCCSSKPPPAVLDFGIFSFPSSLDPAYTQDFAANKILPNIFETLVQYEDSTLNTQPALAESIEISPDATHWTFYLRQDVWFHDGTPFNAEAVRISFDRQINPQSEFYSKDGNTVDVSSLSMIERIEILDTLTVRFYLKYPYVPFNHSLATCFGSSIVSPAALRKYGAEFGKHPVGTGPFQLEVWNEGKNIILSENEVYWGALPKIEKINFIVVPRLIDRAEMINDGSLDIAENVGASHIDRLYLNSNVRLVFDKALGVSVLGFNCQKAPFIDARVRKAVALAFNKEKYVHTMLRGRGLAATGPLPPSLKGSQENIRDYKFDPEAAKRLLVEAGYAEGFRVDLWCFYESERAGVLPLTIKNDLKKIGIEIDIKYINNWQIYDMAVVNGYAPLFVDGWKGDTVDPDSFLYPTFHSRGWGVRGNLFHYSNKELDHILERARRTIDNHERLKLYAEAQRIILSDLPCLFISYLNEVYALRNSVNGFSINSLGLVKLNEVECDIF